MLNESNCTNIIENTQFESKHSFLHWKHTYLTWKHSTKIQNTNFNQNTPFALKAFNLNWKCTNWFKIQKISWKHSNCIENALFELETLELVQNTQIIENTKFDSKHSIKVENTRLNSNHIVCTENTHFDSIKFEINLKIVVVMLHKAKEIFILFFHVKFWKWTIMII